MGTLADYLKMHSQSEAETAAGRKLCPACRVALDSFGECLSCGAPEPKKSEAPVASRLADALARAKTLKKAGGSYTVLDGGKDARLDFGRFRGKRLSEIAVLDKTYLVWMASKRDGLPMFTDELTNIAKRWI